MTTAGGEGSASRPGRSLPPGKTRYPLYRRLGGPQGRSGQVRRISPPTGIRSPDRPVRSQSLKWLRYPAKWSCRRLDIFIPRILNSDLHFHTFSVMVIQELRSCDMSNRNFSRGFFKFRWWRINHLFSYDKAHFHLTSAGVAASLQITHV